MKKHIMLFCVLTLLVGCGGSTPITVSDGPPPDTDENAPLVKFKDKAELDAYFKKIVEDQNKNTSSDSGGDTIFSMPASEAEETSTASDQVETNNQSENVDEGDIIKFAGNRLVILRDQHLLVLDISGYNASRPVLLADRELDTDFGSNTWGKGAWYDEMLIFDSQILLLAYRFNVKLSSDDNTYSRTGAIELLRFKMAADGSLDGGERLFIESNDYYSGATNYATRKIGDSLIIYSPFYGGQFTYGTSGIQSVESRIPYVLELVDAKQKLFKRLQPSIKYEDIYKGSSSTAGYLLHTIYGFDMRESLDKFQASSVTGDYSRIYYITDKHLYLNISRPWWWLCMNEAKKDSENQPSVLYQFQIDKEIKLRNYAEIFGRVPERFAMDERDGKVRLITQGPCNYTSGRSSVSYSNFNAIELNAENIKEGSIASITLDSCYVSSVRFNGNYAVMSPYIYDNDANVLYLASFTGSEPRLSETEVKATNIQLMQPFGNESWVAFGGEGNYTDDSYSFAFKIHLIEMSSEGTLVESASMAMPSASYAWSEAFWNDHAFFFDEERELFGFPYSVWNYEDEYYGHWTDGVQYFSMEGNVLTQIGNGIVQTGEQCQECWYGNTRVVRRDDNYYNLLGRQLKVATYDEIEKIMEELSTVELFEGLQQ